MWHQPTDSSAGARQATVGWEFFKQGDTTKKALGPVTPGSLHLAGISRLREGPVTLTLIIRHVDMGKMVFQVPGS